MNKNSKILRGLFAAAITGGFLLSASSSFAVNNVEITGTVSAVNTVDVTPVGNSLAADVLVTGLTDELIANVKETSNSTTGYTVTLESASAVAAGSATAQLVGATASNTIDYTVEYGTAPVTFVAGSSVVTTDGTNTGTDGISKALTISVVAGSPNADTYSDTLTFTIAAK